MAVQEETAQDEKVEVEVDRTNEEVRKDEQSQGGELKSRCMTAPGGFKNLLWQSALMTISWRKQRKRDSPTTDKHFTEHAPKAFENPADLAQEAKDYSRDTRREQLSYITQTGSAGQKACLREEGLSTSNINKAFLDAAKDILKNN
ncbi:hypothetical protein PROFUN_14904 [Planoprotostelium fungivorum]|uniref:Uncharacterized protein n=1 Tax=Planoprotostelium fungivorum TaxID=1890364 RepID=A0A2P6MYA7_9EUKA|nr:hypothetical protein PROFUN_14904 [Planoprotostelium fungivorum]